MHKWAFLLVFSFMNTSHAQTTAFINFQLISEGSLRKEDALLVENGRIKAIGSSKDITKRAGNTSAIVDGQKNYLMPGFIESHGHLLSTGFSLMNVDVRGKTVAQIKEKLTTSLREKKDDGPLYGRGWDQNLWDQKPFPSFTMLDEVSKKTPIYLKRVDGHALWVNKKAMDLANINRNTKDPVGGTIVKDSKGNPSGVFIDRAMDLFESQHQNKSAEYLKTALKNAIAEAHRFGITSFHDAGTDEKVLTVLQDLAHKKLLDLRVYVMLDGDDKALVTKYLAVGPSTTDPFLVIRSIKYFLDGALGSRGALLLAPYHDDKNTAGLALLNPEEFFKKSLLAVTKGFQVGVHAIGDKANRIALDNFARIDGRDKARLRIEHAQLIDPVDHARFHRLNIIASMQPIHCVSDSGWVSERLGKERLLGRAYAWRSLLKTGALLAFGSDTPVESMNPLLGLHAAITRENASQKAFMKEECLNRQEALKAYQEHAAYAEFSEHEKGKIEVGYLADFVVYRKNLLTVPAKDLLTLTPAMTIVDGITVYKQ